MLHILLNIRKFYHTNPTSYSRKEQEEDTLRFGSWDMESKFGSEQSRDGSTSRNVENKTGTTTAEDQHVMDPILGLLRRREKEESAGEKLLPPLKWSCENEIHTSDPRRFKLQFFNKISSPVLTKETIQGVEGASIPVAIVDCHTGQVVTSGPAASAEVDIMVLKGDPDNVNGEDWTSEVFEKKIVREIEGKKNILKGSLRLKLKEGVSSVGEIYFTHNRHWMKKCHFRLGARVVNNDLGVAVKEAKTDPFLVKDNRKKYDEKHFPPSLSDEVWRLKTIYKKGKYHQQLSKANINTVKDFLTSFNNDPKRLQQILGPGAKLKVSVDHACTCIVSDEIYLYNSPNLELNTGADARKLVLSAFEHWVDVLHFDDENSFLESLKNSLYPLNSSGLGFRDGNNDASSEINSNYVQAQPSTILPDIFSSTYPTEDMTNMHYLDSSGIYTMEWARDQGFNPGDCNLQYENSSVTYAHQENDASSFTLFDGQVYTVEWACDQGLNPGDCNLQHENTSAAYAHQEYDASSLVDGQAGCTAPVNGILTFLFVATEKIFTGLGQLQMRRSQTLGTTGSEGSQTSALLECLHIHRNHVNLEDDASFL
ncbi:hypothetical protein RJ639_034624 [Escallonia herrerae]|uniref:Uncharacterized protein n=1 Tax=Escallonia herrerae TaxID=1293975 RepID=A0AA88WWZ1_9ASTE|nr:hypothetical protein RJ639_034624 [Escallonia herrerae]